jgi:polar amino acid transport system permease protein
MSPRHRARSKAAEGVGPAERVYPERGLSHSIREQTAVSAAIGAVGAASLATLVLGIVGVQTAYGWTPSANVAAAITSTAALQVLVSAIVLGAVAVVSGLFFYGRMPTKAARETAVGGAVFGAQAVAVGGLLLWFSLFGNVEVFARNFFEFSIVGEYWPDFVRGAVNTIILALSGEALGIAIGLVVGVFTLSARPVVRAPARIYINFFRGTPLLWQLQFFFFGIVLGLRLNLGPYEVAILVLGLNAGAYSAEIFRAGIQSLERGQFEAARSLGMGYMKAMRLVILPQAFRRVIPPLTNEFVILLKDTSLVIFLGLTLSQRELLTVGRDIYQTTFNATPYLATAAGYLAITLPMIWLVGRLERKLRSGLTGIGA